MASATKALRMILLSGTALLVAGALFLLLATDFPLADRMLTIRQTPERADVIVVLGGGGAERPLRAAELYRAGLAPRVLISGSGEGEPIRRRLIRAGVPTSAISVENGSTSTYENAAFSGPVLRELNARKILLVTSWFHTRRARAVFRNVAGDMEVVAVPAYPASVARGWRDSAPVVKEYVKIVGYWLRYGVVPVG